MTDDIDIVVRLREEGFITHMGGLSRESKLLHEAADEIKRLNVERDDARREICWFHHLTGFLAGDYANSRGWNYLNDDRYWPECPQSVTNFKLFLEGQDKIFLEINERLRKELEESEKLLDEYQREAADRTRWENINE